MLVIDYEGLSPWLEGDKLELKHEGLCFSRPGIGPRSILGVSRYRLVGKGTTGLDITGKDSGHGVFSVGYSVDSRWPCMPPSKPQS